MNFPNKVIHLFYRLIRKLLLIYWWIFRPKTKGVKVIFIKEDKVLLVRLSYFKSNKWTFPGGGVAVGEGTEEAAKRECMEEVGLEPSNLEFVSEL
ncbi:MAG: NUDIX hydrolase [Candidatus Paceibacterota bacterium]